ncbi:hypothetical protein Droror1_Dr00017285 [Drosera rotundifolia]
MASRYRSAAFNLFKSTVPRKATSKQIPSLRFSTLSFSINPRNVAQLGCLQSLLPLHSTVASARLISCLAVDSSCSRSLSQELGLSVPR